jgi:hypothetical protein
MCRLHRAILAKAPGINLAGLGSEPFCTAIPSEVRHSKDGSRKQFIRQTRWFIDLLEERACPDEVVRGPLPLMFISRNPQSVAFHGGHFARARPDKRNRPLRNGRNAMRSKDLMSPDLLSEVVLLGFGELIFVSLLLFLMAALSRP